MTPKVRSAIDSALKGNGTINAKAARLQLPWQVTKPQLAEIRFAGKLAKIPELMEGDVARPDSFRLAMAYYGWNRGALAGNNVSLAAGQMAAFCTVIIQFQEKYEGSLNDMKNAKQSQEATKKEIV